MCVIAIVPPHARLTRKVFKHCARNNPDGTGIAVGTGSRVLVHKFLDRGRAAWRTLQAIQTAPGRSAPVVVHFRYATHGARDLGNVHPFPVRETYVAHNGILTGYGDDDASDTADFCASVLARLSPDWHSSPRALSTVENLAAGSRLAIVRPSGLVTKLGTGWDHDDVSGVSYSNASWRPYCGAWEYADDDNAPYDYDADGFARGVVFTDGAGYYCARCVGDCATGYGLTPTRLFVGACDHCGRLCDASDDDGPETVGDVLRRDPWHLELVRGIE